MALTAQKQPVATRRTCRSEHLIRESFPDVTALGRMGNNTTIDTGHILLGVLREHGSFAAEMLRGQGMTIEELREQIVKSPVVPDEEPEAPAEGSGVRVKGEAFDAVVSLERIRFLAEELDRSETHGDETRSLLDEIHRQLDALKQHLA